MDSQRQGHADTADAADGYEQTASHSHQARTASPDSIDGSAPGLASNGPATTAEATAAHNGLKARKRTKTGCLTCRKRRIKCGEERPTCANCIKSKRSCEGYAPRLTFKDPLGAYRPAWPIRGAGPHYQSVPAQSGAAGLYGRPPLGFGAGQSLLPAIAPRPNPQYLPHEGPGMPDGRSPEWPAELYHPVEHHSGVAIQPPSDIPSRTYHPPNSATSDLYQPSSATDSPITLRDFQDPRSIQRTPTSGNGGYIGALHSAYPSPEWMRHPSMHEEYSRQIADGYHPPFLGFETRNDTRVKHQRYSGEPAGQPLEDSINLHHFSASLPSNPPAVTALHNHVNVSPHRWAIKRGLEIPDDTSVGPTAETVVSSVNPIGRGLQDLDSRRLAAYDAEDDEFDIEPDDDGLDIDQRISKTPQKDLGLMLALSATRDNRRLRSYTAFLDEPNVLATYRPTFTASPLMDATTARVFCHFITASAPTLSIFERYPANPSVMFTGAPVPTSQQALWTYTLPMMALSNQGLLHAMLALASLHIATLQGAPLTSSLKHYHFALRRVAKAVSTPSKRTEIATVAATLLLGHYEATTAEHSKWNSHLAGVRQLLMETDFKGMTKRIQHHGIRRASPTKTGGWPNPASATSRQPHPNYPHNMYPSKEEGADEALVNALMGWKARADGHSDVVDDRWDFPQPPISERDVDSYNIRSDLFWWFCKHDVYQSVIGGNRLLLPYDRWGDCPPRAPIGRLDAIYGTMDHVVLLVGRIADFAGKDLNRKKKAVEANGGQWRPPGQLGTSPPRAPTGSIPPQRTSPPQPGMPTSADAPMYGMMPNISQPPMPAAFAQAPRDRIYVPASPNDDFELSAATAEAERDWHDIENALDLFEHSLGREWDALPEDLAAPVATPFGLALHYRTYSIACVWIMFYTGRIITARMHPTMPPATMMAAGVAAGQTAHWANLIGRIACGLPLPGPQQALNPSLGGALLESALGLFFGGVQYTDFGQRNETVHRVRTIARLTGLQSAALIAAGCETCWTKMAEAGRGPPYRRTAETSATVAKDERMRQWKGVEKQVEGSGWGGGAEVGGADRRMGHVQRETRLHWAMGVMGVEEDFRDLRIGR